MRTGLLAIALLVAAASLAWSQDYRAAKPEATTTDTAKKEDDFTLGAQAVGNVNELVKKVQVQNENAKKRILEIDAYVNPILGEVAAELYGIKPEEFLFLMKQSQSRRSAGVFRKQRAADTQTPEGILEYFDKAYAAIRAKEYWYGREESLVPQDAALYQTMKTDVLAAIAKRPDGVKIQEMLTERETLLSRLNANLPLFNYLVERREWWKTYPDYMQAVQEESQGVNTETNQGGRRGR